MAHAVSFFVSIINLNIVTISVTSGLYIPTKTDVTLNN